MEIELYEKGRLDREFMTEPQVLERLRELRIVEPYSESPDYEMRVVPGSRRDLMAIPHCGIDGKSDDAWYIDLHTDGDDGAAYLGTTLFHHLANLVGYCQVDELRTANNRIKELERENARISRNLRRMRLLGAELDSVEPDTDSSPKASSGRSVKSGSSNDD